MLQKSFALVFSGLALIGCNQLQPADPNEFPDQLNLICQYESATGLPLQNNIRLDFRGRRGEVLDRGTMGTRKPTSLKIDKTSYSFTQNTVMAAEKRIIERESLAFRYEISSLFGEFKKTVLIGQCR